MTQSRPTDPELDRFLSELEGEVESLSTSPMSAGARDAAGLGLLRLSEALPELAPAPDLRARLLNDAHSEGRLARFAGTVAELLDIGVAKAKELLERIDDPSAWSLELPGISFLWVEGGPGVANAVRGFVRVSAGLDFPEHEHFGEETVLVLQGGFEDVQRGKIFRPGDVDTMPKGTSHGFRALPGGPDLVKLAVVQAGLRALGQEYLPR